MMLFAAGAALTALGLLQVAFRVGEVLSHIPGGGLRVGEVLSHIPGAGKQLICGDHSLVVAMMRSKLTKAASGAKWLYQMLSSSNSNRCNSL